MLVLSLQFMSNNVRLIIPFSWQQSIDYCRTFAYYKLRTVVSSDFFFFVYVW